MKNLIALTLLTSLSFSCRDNDGQPIEAEKLPESSEPQVTIAEIPKNPSKLRAIKSLVCDGDQMIGHVNFLVDGSKELILSVMLSENQLHPDTIDAVMHAGQSEAFHGLLDSTKEFFGYQSEANFKFTLKNNYEGSFTLKTVIDRPFKDSDSVELVLDTPCVEAK